MRALAFDFGGVALIAMIAGFITFGGGNMGR